MSGGTPSVGGSMSWLVPTHAANGASSPKPASPVSWIMHFAKHHFSALREHLCRWRALSNPVNNSARVGLFIAPILSLVIACGGGGSTPSTSPSPVPPTPTSLSFQVLGIAPDWVVYQDGSGTWTTTALTSGSVTLPIQNPSGKYGIAIGYTSGTRRKIRIWQATLAEQSSITFTFLPSVVTVTADTVTGLNQDREANPYFGRDLALPRTFRPGGAFTLSCIPGTADLVVVVQGSTYHVAEGTWIRRNMTFNANTVLPPLDLSGYVPTPQIPVTINGAMVGRNVFWLEQWHTSGGTDASIYEDGLGNVSNPSNTTNRPIVSPSQLGSGDVQSVMGYEGGMNGGINTWRFTTKYFRSASSLTMTLPPAFTGSMAFDATSGRPKATWTPVTDSRYYYASLTQPEISESIIITPGWSGATGTASYVIPNFQAVAPGWDLTAGSTTDWTMYAVGSNLSLKDLSASLQPYKDGDMDWCTANSGSITLSAPQIGPYAALAAPVLSPSMTPKQARQLVRAIRIDQQ